MPSSATRDDYNTFVQLVAPSITGRELYRQTHAAELKAGSESIGQYATLLKARWDGLSEDERAVYDTQAKDLLNDKDRYVHSYHY